MVCVPLHLSFISCLIRFEPYHCRCLAVERHHNVWLLSSPVCTSVCMHKCVWVCGCVCTHTCTYSGQNSSRSLVNFRTFLRTTTHSSTWAVGVCANDQSKSTVLQHLTVQPLNPILTIVLIYLIYICVCVCVCARACMYVTLYILKCSLHVDLLRFLLSLTKDEALRPEYPTLFVSAYSYCCFCQGVGGDVLYCIV